MLTPVQVEDHLHNLASGPEAPSHEIQMAEIGIAQAFQLTRIAAALEKIIELAGEQKSEGG